MSLYDLAAGAAGAAEAPLVLVAEEVGGVVGSGDIGISLGWARGEVAAAIGVGLGDDRIDARESGGHLSERDSPARENQRRID